MKYADLTQQMAVENGLLRYLMEGVRHTLAWKPHGPDFARKLSTLRFITRSLQRHLERVMNLEERDGYMNIVLVQKQHLDKAVVGLKHDHQEFRAKLEVILQDLEKLPPTDHAAFAKVSVNINQLLDQFSSHTTKEADLFQEAFERDEGGEG